MIGRRSFSVAFVLCAVGCSSPERSFESETPDTGSVATTDTGAPDTSISPTDSGTPPVDTGSTTPPDTTTTTPPDEGLDTAGFTDAGDLDAAIFNCTGKPDGTSCGGVQICLGGACVTSSCGDKFINAMAGEECEDGNDVSGDGCSACKFDCKADTDCKDDNSCTTETCDKSVAGKASCKTVTLADKTACTTTEGAAGTCKAGACQKAGCGDGVKGATEECDDGNADDSDGCKADCTFTCKTNADCDDGDKCNGAETCDTTTHKCKGGTAVNCTASATCVGTCDATTGACTYPDLDKDGVACNKDCNDADPAMFPGAYECKDGKDNDCNPATSDTTAPSCLCYADADKDGYAALGAASITSAAASCPDGYTRRVPVTGDATTYDCRESNSSVFPTQSTYFTSSYCVGKLLYNPTTMTFYCPTPSYDYNCDGAVTKQYTALAAKVCTPFCIGTKCSCSGSGWLATAAPECGATADYKSCSVFGTSCLSTTAKRTQGCR